MFPWLCECESSQLTRHLNPRSIVDPRQFYRWYVLPPCYCSHYQPPTNLMLWTINDHVSCFFLFSSWDPAAFLFLLLLSLVLDRCSIAALSNCKRSCPHQNEAFCKDLWPQFLLFCCYYVNDPPPPPPPGAQRHYHQNHYRFHQGAVYTRVSHFYPFFELSLVLLTTQAHGL